MNTLQELPAGAMMVFANLPLDATEEELSQFFYSIGLEVPPTSICVQTGRDSTTGARACWATISLHRTETAKLVNWAINSAKFRDCTMHAKIPRPPRVRR